MSMVTKKQNHAKTESIMEHAVIHHADMLCKSI